MGYLSKGFVITWLISFALLVGTLYVWSSQTYLTATSQQANQTRTQVETERVTITVESVFINNFLVSIYLVIPFLGIFPFLYVWYNTATTIGLLSLAYNIPPQNYVMALTMLAFFEIAAYTTLLAENLYIMFLAIFKHEGKKRLLSESWKSFILYLIFLLIGALTEVWLSV